MNYQISINYTDNPNKAGKLTLTNLSNEVILDKVPVSIPDSYLKNGNNVESLSVSMELKNITTNIRLTSDVGYYQSAKKISGLDSIIKTNTGYGFIANTQSTNELLNTTQDCFVLLDKDYKKLEQICSMDSFNRVDLTTKKVSFLWFPGNVNRNNELLNVSVALNVMDKKEKEFLAKEKALYTKPVEAKKNNKKLYIDHFQADTDVKYAPQEEGTKKSDKSTYLVLNTNGSKIDANQARIRQDEERRRQADEDYRRRQSNDSSNNLDAFDVVFMYNNPGLAPMYKPNSMLAWALYFNNDDKQVNNVSVRENINSIPGFEKVENTEVKYTTSGYSVNMYEDEQKQKLIGTLVHDSNDSSYIIESPNGGKTTLNMDSNGDAKGYVNGEKGDTNFNFVQNGSGGFSGNWESESSQGIKISSGVSMSENFAPKSSPFEPVDIGAVIQNRYNTTNDIKIEPPPPPPPPPSDDARWSSSNDSYNSGSSFSP